MKKLSKLNLSAPSRLERANPDKTTVRDYFGPYSMSYNGPLYGLEIEVESPADRYTSNTILNAMAKQWTSINDGSLRRSDGSAGGGREYIFLKPFSFEDSLQALADLDAAFTHSGQKLTNSIRTSTHVHMNVQDMTLRELCTLLLLYYTVEPMLSKYNGTDREQNLFCLQAQHSPACIDEILEYFKTRRLNNNLKYSALNVMPLQSRSFGTVEFRAGRGIDTTPLEIVPWLTMINEIRGCVEAFDNPQQIVGMFSSLSPTGFVKKYLPFIFDKTSVLFDSPEDLRLILVDSLRAVQQLAYDIDWSDYEPQVKTSTNTKKKTLTGGDGGRQFAYDYARLYNEGLRLRVAEPVAVNPAALFNVNSPAEIFNDDPTLEEYQLTGDDIEVNLEVASDDGLDISSWTLFVRDLYENHGYDFLERRRIIPSCNRVSSECIGRTRWDVSTLEEKAQTFNDVLESLWRN